MKCTKNSEITSICVDAKLPYCWYGLIAFGFFQQTVHIDEKCLISWVFAVFLVRNSHFRLTHWYVCTKNHKIEYIFSLKAERFHKTGADFWHRRTVHIYCQSHVENMEPMGFAFFSFVIMCCRFSNCPDRIKAVIRYDCFSGCNGP